MLALDPDGTVITAQANYSYVIEVWDTTGVREHRLVRDVEWFRPWTMEPLPREGRGRANRREYKPRITGLHLDEANRLWVCVTVADRDWKDAPEDDYTRQFDTIIDVIDIRAGALHSTHRLDRMVNRVLPNGLLYSVQQAESGLLQFVVWRPELRTH